MRALKCFVLRLLWRSNFQAVRVLFRVLPACLMESLTVMATLSPRAHSQERWRVIEQKERRRFSVSRCFCPNRPVARTCRKRQGLAVRGQLNLQTERGRQAHEHMKAGDVTGLSIGYRVPPGGRVSNPDGTSTLTEIDLMEISAVTMPAARRARVSSVKSVASQADAERVLREGGFSRAAALKIATGGWPALLGDEDDNPAVDSLIKAIQNSTNQLKGTFL